MKKKSIWRHWVAACLVLSCGAAAAAPLCLALPDVSPFARPDADGHSQRDPNLGLTELLQRRSGLEFTIRLVPLARAMYEIGRGQCDMTLLLPVPKPSPEIRALGPLGSLEVMLLPRKDVKPPAGEVWHGARIVGLIGGVAWSPLISLGDVTRVQVASPVAMLGMLKAGRADAAVGARYMLEQAMSQNGHQPSDFGRPQLLARLPIQLYAGPRLSAEDAERLKSALKAIAAAGEADALLAR